MNSQCPRCLSSMFPIVEASSAIRTLPNGYRIIYQNSCKFCEDLDVSKQSFVFKEATRTFIVQTTPKVIDGPRT